MFDPRYVQSLQGLIPKHQLRIIEAFSSSEKSIIFLAKVRMNFDCLSANSTDHTRD